jgi:hypothetical protein
MGTAVVPAAAAGTGAPEFAYRRIDAGQLQDVALNPITPAILYGQVFATVGVMRGGRGDQFIEAVFISDYVSQNHRPTSPCTYRFQSNDELFVRLVTIIPVELRLGLTVHHEAPAG